MNPACAACKGACCESLVLPLPRDPDAQVWILMRGRREGRTVRLEVPCEHLTGEGACGVHEVKPMVCRLYQVGSPQCIAAIRARRGNDAPRLIKLAKEFQG